MERKGFLRRIGQSWNWGQVRRDFISYVWSVRLLTPFIVGVLIGSFIGILVIVFSPNPQSDEPVMTAALGAIGSLFLGISIIIIIFLLSLRYTLFTHLYKAKIRSEQSRQVVNHNQRLYSTGVQNLKHNSIEVRLKAISELEQLAKESRDSEEILIDEITETLCSHLRNITCTEEYLKAHRDEPSVETTTILKVLTQGDDNPFDSSEFELNGVHLSGANLSQANLSEAYLRDANLTGANLSQADFWGAYVSEVDFTGADLSRADLSEAYLRDANLTGADLSEVDLSGANLNNADLSGTNLSKAIRLTYNKNEWANFEECQFSCEDGKRTDLRGIYWGVFTKGLADVVWAAKTAKGANTQSRLGLYISDNAVTRNPTKKEKERLVGKSNVDKCMWGVVQILEEINAHENLEDLTYSTQNLNLQYSN